MGSKLNANVWVGGVLYRKGTTPPGDVAAKVTNPKVWATPSSDESTVREIPIRKREDGIEFPEHPQRVELEKVQEPPRGGPGSSAAAWAKFAVEQGVEVPEGASAKEIAALWDTKKDEE